MTPLPAVYSLIGFAAVLALLGGQRSGRKIALMAAVLSASDIPLGETLEIYKLVELLPIKTTQLFARLGQAA
jgi:hypothetical protein